MKTFDREQWLTRETAKRVGETVFASLWYPRVEGKDSVRFVNVGLSDVRAADNIRIHYDFERDGYVIEQGSKFEWPIEEPECDPDWQEVAFIRAWARENKTE